MNEGWMFESLVMYMVRALTLIMSELSEIRFCEMITKKSAEFKNRVGLVSTMTGPGMTINRVDLVSTMTRYGMTMDRLIESIIWLV